MWKGLGQQPDVRRDPGHGLALGRTGRSSRINSFQIPRREAHELIISVSADEVRSARLEASDSGAGQVCPFRKPPKVVLGPKNGPRRAWTEGFSCCPTRAKQKHARTRIRRGPAAPPAPPASAAVISP